MMRRFVMTASLLVAGAVVVSAQSHPQSHSQGRPHDAAGHAPMDPALHAALHALMHGDWHGTVRTQTSAPGSVDLKVTTDKAGKLTFQLTGDPAAHLGSSSQFAVDGQAIRWTQEVAGKPCPVAAKVVAATAKEPQTLTGTMSCADGERTLALRQTKQ